MLREHLKFKHSIGKIEMKKCKECSFQSSENFAFREHMEVVHEGKRYTCEKEKCDYFSKNSQMLLRHVLLKHEGGQIEKIPCSQCNHKALSKYLLQEHIDVVHNGKRYNCEKCIFSGKSAMALRAHNEIRH